MSKYSLEDIFQWINEGDVSPRPERLPHYLRAIAYSLAILVEKKLEEETHGKSTRRPRSTRAK